MASKDPDDNCNTETEEETIARMKRRARRVSFAETTAVHFYDRDEESDKTPLSSKGEEELWRTESDEIRTLFQANGVCGEEEEEDGEVPGRKSFFRPVETPSPASSTFGSATSNDEEKFFGPVSSDFIKRGLSNSAGSDDNHDITMDSTTFSMHFRSLARSESGGDMKTPTGFRLVFGENSQTETARSNVGNVMVLTGEKSPAAHLPLPVEKSRENLDSNDMSLLGDNPNKYDYGRISPDLDALFAEDQRDAEAVSLFTRPEGSISADCLREENLGRVHENGTPLPLTDHGDPQTICSTNACGTPSKPLALSRAIEEATILPCSPEPVDQRMQEDISFGKEHGPMDESLVADRTPIQREDVGESIASARYSEKLKKRKLEFDESLAQISLNSEDQARSFLAGSISSLSNKRKKIFKHASNSSFCERNSTHLLNQPVASDSKGSERMIFSLPLSGKSVSRLKRLEGFSFTSLSEAGADHTRVMSATQLSKSLIKKSVSEGKPLNDRLKHLDAPVACLEEQFLDATMDCDKENLDISSLKTLNQIVAMGQDLSVGKATAGANGRPALPVTGSFNSKQWKDLAGSVSHTTNLGTQESGHLLSTDNASEANLSPAGNESPLLEATLNDDKHTEAIALNSKVRQVWLESPNQKTLSNAPDQSRIAGLIQDRHSVTSPSIAADSCLQAEKEVVTLESTEGQQSIEEARKQPFTVALCDGGNSAANVSMADNPTSRAENPGFFIDCQKSVPSLCSELEQPANPVPDNRMNDAKTVPDNFQQVSHTPLRHVVSEGCQLNGSIKTRTTSRATDPAEDLLLRPMCFQQEQSFQSSLEETCVLANDVVAQRTGHIALGSYQNRTGNSHGSLHTAFQSINGNFPSIIRSLAGTVGKDMEEMVQVSPLSKRQKFFSDNDHDGALRNRCFNGISTVAQKIGGGPLNLNDVFRNFNLQMDKWVSSSFVNINAHLIEELGDVLVNLQKFAASKFIHSGMYSQVSEDLVHGQIKRVAEIKLLLYKALYEKVKVQLLLLKKTRILEQIKLIQSAVKESGSLKSKCCLMLHGFGQQDDEVGSCSSQSSAIDQERNNAAGECISELELALESSENQIEDIITSFHSSLKMQHGGNRNSTILFIVDHFKRKVPCWSLQHKLQLWEVDSAEDKNGQLNVVLNYDGILSQRFNLKRKPKSIVSISSQFSSAGMSKTWPNMSASTAFEFALSGKTSLKYSGPSIFSQETQRVSSVFCNLCDVLEEIKLAQIELGNLSKTSFHLASGGRLDLQVFFINYNNGARIKLSLDMSCLSCGVYPAEIIPYDVRYEETGKRNMRSPSLLDDIKAAAAGIRVGYMRITRLCRSISGVIAAADK